MDPRATYVSRRACLVAALAAWRAPALAGVASAYGLGLHFVDDRGRARELAEWRGRAVVLTMAYGACRSVCSTTLRVLDELQALADRRGVRLDFVIASVDPAEDTPAVWADWRRARRLERDNWTFLCGSESATRLLAGFLGIRRWRYDDHMLHDFRIVRLDADGHAGAAVEWNRRELNALL